MSDTLGGQFFLRQGPYMNYFFFSLYMYGTCIIKQLTLGKAG